MDRTAYERKADSFLTDVVSEQYEVGAGLKETLELTPIYRRCADFLSDDAVRARLVEIESFAGRYLANFDLVGFLGNWGAALSEEIANAELAALPWDGADDASQDVPILLVNEDDRSRRVELARRYHLKQAELNPKRARRWNQLHELTRALGSDSYIAAFEQLRALGLHCLCEQVTCLST
jgi:hypothetical protein